MSILRRVTTIAVAISVIAGAIQPASAADRYRVETVVAGSAMKGVHGLAFDPAGVLHAVSITGMSIYKVDTKTGAVVTVVGPPDGVGDDLAFGPDGSLAWTARDRVLLRTPAGQIVTVAEGLDGLNSINFGPDGRLFFTIIFRGDALYEGDPTGKKPPRLIAEKLGGLNGFEVTKDGSSIIGPLFFGNAIAKIDVETGATTKITDGIDTPAAVNLLSNGDIIALGYRTGMVFRIDPRTGDKKVLATLDGPLDNLAIDKADRVYISHSSYNGISELDPDTGATRRIVWGNLSAPAGLATMTADGHDQVLIADAWGYRAFDPLTGTVAMIPAAPTVFGSSGIAVSADRIITTNAAPAGMVQVIDRATGKPLRSVFGLRAPYGVLTTPEGVLIADYGADALVLIGHGDNPSRTTVATGLGGPVGLAPAEEGSVYVTGYTDGTVSRVNLGDGTRTIVATGLAMPEAVARLSDGQLAVADIGKRRVIIVSPATGSVDVAADNLAIGYDLGGAGPAPGLFTGVAATADGAIYVTGDADNSLIRITRK